MRSSQVRAWTVACAAVALLGMAAEPAFAQSPGAPVVNVQANNVVLITYNAPVTPPAGTVIVGTLNGVPIGPFAIGTATSISSGAPVAAGNYSIQIVWGSGVASPFTNFVVGPPAGGGLPFTTTMRPAIITGTSVTLGWETIANATSYDIEATVINTGQVINFQVGNQTAVNVPNVPFGNYRARVRGRNALGVGAYSNEILVIVGVVLGTGDVQVTLSWNSVADIDLNMREPNGTRVYFASRTGPTSRLDFDDTNGFGPENIFVGAGGAAPGIYQIYLVHYATNVPTTSTVAITLRAGSPNARTVLFSRQTSVGATTTGFNVANVDVVNGVVTETFGARAALSLEDGAAEVVKSPQQ